MKMKKRQSTSERDKEEDRDMLSELPDCVLVHIMNFMDTKDAVQTCVLSKRWKDLWKSLTNFSFDCSHFRRIANFSKFISWVLSSRDGSISLHSLDFLRYRSSDPKLVNKVAKYAVLHNVQQLTIDIKFHHKIIPEFFIPSIFSSPSLTILKLSIDCHGPALHLPKSLQLPALKSLHLEYAIFSASDNDCVEPFSTCNLLNTLVIDSCFLHKDAKFLSISNSNLSSLTVDNTECIIACKIVLSTPNLRFLNIKDYYSCHQLSSTCNLSFLEEVNIGTSSGIYYPVAIRWLQVVTNVKILTLSSGTLDKIMKDLSNHATTRTQPPCFVRLESFKVTMDPHAKISDEEVNRIMDYLLQNSPLSTNQS